MDKFYAILSTFCILLKPLMLDYFFKFAKGQIYDRHFKRSSLIHEFYNDQTANT